MPEKSHTRETGYPAARSAAVSTVAPVMALNPVVRSYVVPCSFPAALLIGSSKMSSVALGQYAPLSARVPVKRFTPSTSVSIQRFAREALVSVPVADAITTSPETAFVCFAMK